MPPERVLPVCPRAVATARPGREAWALEEVLDALAPEPDAVAVETGYPGVFGVISSSPPCRLASLFMGWEYSFVRSIVVAEKCGPCESGERLAGLVAGACPRRARFLFRLRGPCKGAFDPREAASRAGVSEARGSRYVLAVEGVGGWVIASCGVAVERPYGALVVVPRSCGKS
ncbi:MAG: hypothetical protein F7C34_03880 [Desulfurococcales archaeon]|nr:hypothetical protein [Desulfurococcales archaeon]